VVPVAGLAAGLGAAAGLGGGAAGLLGAGVLFFFCAAAKAGMAIKSSESRKPLATVFLRWLQFIINPPQKIPLEFHLKELRRDQSAQSTRVDGEENRARPLRLHGCF